VFYKETFSKFKEKHKEMKATEIARALGKQWKSLSPEEQQRYNEQAASERA
jgi:ABC-type transporter MlaC component